MYWWFEFWGSFSIYRENIAIYSPAWLKQWWRKALQCSCFSLHQYSATAAAFLSVIPHEVCCVLLVNEPFWISNRISAWHQPKLLDILFIALAEKKHRNRCWWSLNHAGLCFCHICNFIRWSPFFFYWKKKCAHALPYHTEVEPRNSEVKMRGKVVCIPALWPDQYTTICACVHYSVWVSIQNFMLLMQHCSKKGTTENYSTLPFYLPPSEFLDLGTGLWKGWSSGEKDVGWQWVMYTQIQACTLRKEMCGMWSVLC